MKKPISIISIIIVFIILLCGCTKPEETGTITGIVTDKATGEPIKNAGIELEPSGRKVN